jgi:hypothetical protein
VKRWLITSAFFLLAGVIASITITWGCALVPARLWWPPHSASSDSKPWPRAVPERWPARAHFLRRQVPGRSVEEYGAIAPTANRDELWRAEQYSITIGSAGWPCRALQWERWQVINSLRPNELPQHSWWLSGIFIPTASSYPSHLHTTILPLRPLWPGFAINAVFYAVLLWLICRAVYRFRRIVRSHRGLCPSCGYPMGSTPVCTECGQPLTKRAVA